MGARLSAGVAIEDPGTTLCCDGEGTAVVLTDGLGVTLSCGGCGAASPYWVLIFAAAETEAILLGLRSAIDGGWCNLGGAALLNSWQLLFGVLEALRLIDSLERSTKLLVFRLCECVEDSADLSRSCRLVGCTGCTGGADFRGFFCFGAAG